ncbi:PREDICTED: uncharacterized protein LOC105453628 [Wasmannia auropunctata]|uniref:uncharacterized protein LOC105453628 n=1 Tax=Wasmannia auropunctata TaxID=64793 RepID=UPI0005EDCF8D|nr:PREDICTED: uncharacterized protein LOC105453628 [Wasmannia auropunctata]
MLEAVNRKVQSSSQSQVKVSSAKVSLCVSSKTASCQKCKGDHQIFACEQFLKVSPEERLKIIREHKLCCNCLKFSSHSAKTCRSGNCRTCGKRHNTLLHISRDEPEAKVAALPSQSTSQQANAPTANVAHTAITNSSSQVFLSTALITERLPSMAMDKGTFKVPQNLPLADPEFYRPTDIDILLGAEMFWNTLCIGQIKESSEHPLLQKTLFGWIIGGKYSSNSALQGTVQCNLSVNRINLEQAIERFWQTEQVLVRPVLTAEERECEEQFIKTHRRTELGRFIAQLPIKADKLQTLERSYDIALKRFYSLERKLNRHPKMKGEYARFIQEYLELGHMHPVTLEAQRAFPIYYIPHHAVFKNNSSTTKIRVVFDASCKTDTGVSLNDILMVGPTLQQDLISILIKFCIWQYVLTGDVAKMYRQVLVDESQQGLQRILWRNSAEEEVKIFELATVTYGTASASFLASDTFQFSISLTKQRKITKRNIFSSIAHIFDPLGILGPIVITAKIFMQRLWQLKVDWDEAVPSDIQTQWSRYESELHLLNKLQISRKMPVKMHMKLAYIFGASHQKVITNQIYCAKSRVAPLKNISLPRLELCAALILAQLMHKISTFIDVKFTRIYYWSDSTITLSWIRSVPRRWSTFVANRVRTIQDISDPSDWYYVDSAHNPADIISRRMPPSSLLKADLWWKGPTWLSQDTANWHIQPLISDQEVPEQRKMIATTITTSELPWLFDRCSTFNKLIRVHGYIRRFLNNCRSSKPKIKEGGRLQYVSLPYSAKHQMVIPSRHSFTKLLIEHEHTRLLHAGSQTTLASLRQRFWPLNGRNTVRHIIRKCIKCFRANPSIIQPIMGNLPKQRVQVSRVFSNVGVDFCGPFQLRESKRRNAKTVKSYAAIFVCLATKAVEITFNLSSEGFIHVLKRFIGRRDKPSHIFSDNATNFVGADRELRELQTLFTQEGHKISHDSVVQGIQWHFNLTA